VSGRFLGADGPHRARGVRGRQLRDPGVLWSSLTSSAVSTGMSGSQGKHERRNTHRDDDGVRIIPCAHGLRWSYHHCWSAVDGGLPTGRDGQDEQVDALPMSTQPNNIRVRLRFKQRLDACADEGAISKGNR